jgi:hypothetical protein
VLPGSARNPYNKSDHFARQSLVFSIPRRSLIGANLVFIDLNLRVSGVVEEFISILHLQGPFSGWLPKAILDCVPI